MMKITSMAKETKAFKCVPQRALESFAKEGHSTLIKDKRLKCKETLVITGHYFYSLVDLNIGLKS